MRVLNQRNRFKVVEAHIIPEGRVKWKRTDRVCQYSLEKGGKVGSYVKHASAFEGATYVWPATARQGSECCLDSIMIDFTTEEDAPATQADRKSSFRIFIMY